jgi:hypothetical protein
LYSEKLSKSGIPSNKPQRIKTDESGGAGDYINAARPCVMTRPQSTLDVAAKHALCMRF